MGCNKMNNQELNQDLFDIVNGHSYDTYATNYIENNQPEHFKISRTASKKNKKSNLKLTNKNLKKITIASFGTIIVLSSALIATIANKTDDKQEDNEVTITVIDNRVQNETINNLIDDLNINNNSKINIDPKIIIDPKINSDADEVKISDPNQNMAQKELFEVGNNQYIDYVYKYMDTSDYNYFEKNGLNYGVPPQIMVAKGMQETSLMHRECLPGGEYYNGCAIGIMQLEKNCNNNVSAFNYSYNDNELAKYNDNELCDIENNIKVGCMRFQRAIEKYNGNLYVAIQAYNFGEVMTDKAIELTAKEKGTDVSSILSNYQDLDWMKYIEDIHNNPNKYLSDWKYDTYGDAKYLYKVLSYCPTTKVSYKFNGSEYTFDLQYGLSENIGSKQI